MTAVILFLALTALLGLASIAGFTYDSRDPEYSLGRVIHSRHAVPEPRVLSGRRGPRSSADRATAF